MQKASLTAFDIGCVVVGGIVGVGIFFTPSSVAAAVDDAWQVVLAWAIGGVIALLGALVFAELGCRVPGHGGTFLYIRAAFGDRPAFLYGWANWLVIQSGALAVIGMVMVSYLEIALFGRDALGGAARTAIAAGAIALFTVLNVIGLRVGSGVQNALTVTKLCAVFGLVVLAFFAGDSAPAVVTAPREPRGLWTALAAAMLPVLFSFGGWQHGSFVAGAAARPLRDVPLGIVGGVVVVVIAYLTVNLSFLQVLGFEGAARSASIGADAARAALEPFGWGAVGARVLAVMVVVSSLGVLNTICLAPPYVLHAMARERLFFASCRTLHARFGTPVIAVVVQGAWGITLLLCAHFAFGEEGQDKLGFLLSGVVFVDWLFFFLCGLALLRLRSRPDEGGFRAPFGGTVTAAFTALALAVTAGAVWSAPGPSAVGFGVCALGLVVHELARRRDLRQYPRSSD